MYEKVNRTVKLLNHMLIIYSSYLRNFKTGPPPITRVSYERAVKTDCVRTFIRDFCKHFVQMDSELSVINLLSDPKM